MLATLSIACATAVAAPEDPRPATGQAQWYVVDLLDPEHPAEQRQRLLENLHQEAEAGNHRAATLLGHLYFLGPQHPSGLVDRQLDLAERHFRTALDAGDTNALTALAELELERGRPGEAMVWLQAHIIIEEHRGHEFRDDSYAVALLARIRKSGSGRHINDATLVERVQDVVDSHGTRILAHDAQNLHDIAPGLSWSPRVEAPECREVRTDTDGIPARRSARSMWTSRWVGGLAQYLVSLSPQGEVVDVVMLSAMPNALYATDMEASVRNMSFNAVDDACPLRWNLLRVDSGDFRTRMR